MSDSVGLISNFFVYVKKPEIIIANLQPIDSKFVKSSVIR